MKVIASAIGAAVILTATAGADEPTRVLEPESSWHVDHATHHVQGLSVSDDEFWISSVDRGMKAGFIFLVDRGTLKVTSTRRLAFGPQYHPGGMQRVGERLWVPVAEYRPRSTTTIVALDASTLETERKFTLDDHIGALAADGAGTLFAANWDARQIYLLDEDGHVQERVDTPTSVAYQDMEWHRGRLWATGVASIESRRAAVVDVIDPDTWQLEERYELKGRLRSGEGHFAREGFCFFKDDFYLLPEDGPHTTVYRFSRRAGGDD